jgi:hypothetical protein
MDKLPIIENTRSVKMRRQWYDRIGMVEKEVAKAGKSKSRAAAADPADD